MTQADPFAHLPPIDPAKLQERRDRVFLVFAGIFLGTLAMLNILGVTRFISIACYTPGQGFEWGSFGKYSFAVAVGVLPYPITFLCTDLISEFYGRKRANFVVLVGLLLNIWVMSILWVGGVLPGTESPAFFEVRKLAFGAVTASMIAYLIAQLVDVQLFHFWKHLTGGKALWLRNNGSTLVSQAVDTVAVIYITWWVGGLDEMIEGQDIENIPRFLVTLILTGYVFKLVAALVDTPVIYGAVFLLRGYLRLDPVREHASDREAPGLPDSRNNSGGAQDGSHGQAP